MHACDHCATEQDIRASGLPSTFLRDCMYATSCRCSSATDGAVRGPAGEGRIATVAVLRDRDVHAGQTCDMTGLQALDLDEVAIVLADAVGRELRYQQVTIVRACVPRRVRRPALARRRLHVDYTAIAVGELDGVSDDIARVTGRPLRTLADLLGDRDA